MKAMCRTILRPGIWSLALAVGFGLALADLSEAVPMCYGGSVIWQQREGVGCVFKQWGEGEQAMCNGLALLHNQLPPRLHPSCWVCIEKGLVPVVKSPAKWSSLRVCVNRDSAKTADFSCLGIVGKAEPHSFNTPQEPLVGGVQHLEACKWTPWLNRDSPGGSGDYETLNDFVSAGKACAKPEKVECRARDGRTPAQTGDVVSCTKQGGAVCVNKKQRPGHRCSDYEVRFCCS